MIKYLSAIAFAVALSACSSDSSTEPSTSTGNNNGTTGNAGGTSGGQSGGSPTVSGGGPITPSGNINGVWFGTNNFGEGVMIVDSNGNVHSLAENDMDNFQTVSGPSSGNLQVLSHRKSDNPSFADSFTLVGEASPDPILYNLTVSNEGQQIDNASAVGNFSMTFATENDVAPISIDSIVGEWAARTSYCEAGCDLLLSVIINATGGMTGFTQNNNDDQLSFSGGTVTVDQGASQYLLIDFTWLGKRRAGVLHFDRNDPSRLVINTSGPSDTEGVPESITARMVRQ